MLKQGVKQQGAALVIGLVILLVMTLLGVTSMNTSRTELKISNNIQNQGTAYQTAETGIQSVLLNSLVNWSNINTEQSFSYAPEEQSYFAEVSMEFEDCRRNQEGYSLEGDGIGDGRGGAFPSVIHRLSSEGLTENSLGGTVAKSTVVVGVKTQLAGCTPPGS